MISDKKIEYPLCPLAAPGISPPGSAWKKAKLNQLVIQDGIFIQWEETIFNGEKYMAGFVLVSLNGPIANKEVIESLANTRLQTHPIFKDANFV